MAVWLPIVESRVPADWRPGASAAGRDERNAERIPGGDLRPCRRPRAHPPWEKPDALTAAARPFLEQAMGSR